MPNYGIPQFEAVSALAFFPLSSFILYVGDASMQCENKLIERLWQSQSRPLPTTVLWLEDVFITVWEYAEKGQ